MLAAAAATDSSTSGNQVTLIAVASIAAVSNILGVVLTAFFARQVVRVKKVTEATHAIVNHDRTIILEGNALTLRIAAADHPRDAGLQLAASRAEQAAQDARDANAPADTKTD